jgi:cytochrome P450
MDDLARRIADSDFLHGINTYYTDFGPLVKHKIRGQYEVYAFDPSDIVTMFQNDDVIPKTPLTEFGPLKLYYESRRMPAPFSSVKEDWRRNRTALQKDIFPRAAAASYVSALNDPCAAAVKVFDKAPVEVLLPYVSFDMFFRVAFGQESPLMTPKLADPGREKEELDIFIEEAMLQGELLLAAYFGFSESQDQAANAQLQHYFSVMDSVHARGLKMIREAGDRVVANDYENKFKPYFKRVLDGGKTTYEDLTTNLVTLFLAGIDSTSSVISWVMLNLARFPHVQEKVYREIMEVVGDGELTEEHLNRLVYLSQVIRETHRFTSPGPLTTARTLDHPVVLSGYTVPPGVRIQVGTNAYQWDPRFVERPEEFLPERWSKEAQLARKGTPAEALDSLVIARPFGLGSRMCIAARLVDVELKVFLTHLVREWQFSYDPSQQEYKVVMRTVTVPRPYPKMEWKRRCEE